MYALGTIVHYKERYLSSIILERITVLVLFQSNLCILCIVTGFCNLKDDEGTDLRKTHYLLGEISSK